MIRAALLLTITLLFAQTPIAADEVKQPQPNTIPNQVRAVLGCDTRIEGNGIGLDGKAGEMLAGYSPPSSGGNGQHRDQERCPLVLISGTIKKQVSHPRTDR
jgi:hypothetical protein